MAMLGAKAPVPLLGFLFSMEKSSLCLFLHRDFPTHIFGIIREDDKEEPFLHLLLTLPSFSFFRRKKDQQQILFPHAKELRKNKTSYQTIFFSHFLVLSHWILLTGLQEACTFSRFTRPLEKLKLCSENSPGIPQFSSKTATPTPTGFCW